MKYLIAIFLVSFLSPNIVFGYDDKEIIKHIIENEMYQGNVDKAYSKIKKQFDIDRSNFKALFEPVKDVFNNAALFLNPKTRQATRTIIDNKIYEEEKEADAWSRFQKAGFGVPIKVGIEFLKKICKTAWAWIKKAGVEIASAVFSIIYVDDSLNNDSERFDKLDKGQEKINDRLDRHEKKIDRIDERSERNDRRLDDLEKNK